MHDVMGNTHPVLNTVSTSLRSPWCSANAVELQGCRRTMEDEVVMFADHDYAVFAVLDGHGGSTAAHYMKQHLLTALQPLEDVHNHHILKARIRALDTRFTEQARDDSGSTLALAIICRKTMTAVIAHVGDSQVRLNGETVLTVDHTPRLRSEANRVVAAGGFVANNRVNGNLAVSRALGDRHFKTKWINVVSAEPDCVTVQLKDSDRLLLYCDGFTERMSEAELTSAIMRLYGKDEFIQELICESIRKGSQDNHSVIAIRVHQPAEEKTREEMTRVFDLKPFAPEAWADPVFRRSYLHNALLYGGKSRRDVLSFHHMDEEEDNASDTTEPLDDLACTKVRKLND